MCSPTLVYRTSTEALLLWLCTSEKGVRCLVKIGENADFPTWSGIVVGVKFALSTTLPPAAGPPHQITLPHRPTPLLLGANVDEKTTHTYSLTHKYQRAVQQATTQQAFLAAGSCWVSGSWPVWFCHSNPLQLTLLQLGGFKPPLVLPLPLPALPRIAYMLVVVGCDT